MGTTKTILSTTALTGLLLSSMEAFSAPEAIVIEQNSSQVTEQLTSQSALSFTPIHGTILPISNQYSPFQLPDFQNIERRNWSEHLGQPVRVEHKSRNLSLEGTLESISGGYFTLSVKRVASSYPMSDFYLIPKLAASPSRQGLDYQGQITYQTQDLSWHPELSLIIEDRRVTLLQQAAIRNQASKDIELSQALLHYNQRRNIGRPMLKATMANDMQLESAAAPDTDYSNSEITLELTDLNLPAASETLVDLGRNSSVITSRSNIASVFSYPSSDKLPLNFTQQITFNSPKDLIPGSYQTLWHKSPYYVRGNQAALKDVREKAEVHVQLNRSLDLSGDLFLVAESSDKSSITQTWELNIKNLSKQDQEYEIVHRTSSPIKEVSLRALEQPTANSLSLKGNIAPNSTYQVRYTIELDNR